MANLLDILKVDVAHVDDIEITATGDIDKIDGLENIKTAIFHRLVTQPGALIHRPDYGVGIRSFQNSLSSLGKQRELAIKIAEQLVKDPRIVEVKGVRIIPNDSQPWLTKIIINLTIQGYEDTSIGLTPFGEG